MSIVTQYGPAGSYAGVVIDKGGAEHNALGANIVADARLLSGIGTTSGSKVLNVSGLTQADVGKVCNIPAAGIPNRIVTGAGQMTAGSNVLACAGAVFIAADLQTNIVVRGAGPGGSDLYTCIIGGTASDGTFVDNAHVILHDNAQTTVTTADIVIGVTSLQDTIASVSGSTVTLTTHTAGATLSNALGVIGTDNTNAHNTLANLLNTGGGGTIRYPAGSYLFLGQLNGYESVRVLGSGIFATKFYTTDTVSNGLEYNNAPAGSVALASDLTGDANTAVLATGGGAHFSPGDVVFLADNNSGNAVGQAGNGSFMTRVRDVNVDTLILTQACPINFQVSASAKAYYYTGGAPWQGVEIADFTIQVVTPAVTLPALNKNIGVYALHCLTPRIRRVRSRNFLTPFQVNNLLGGSTEGCTADYSGNLYTGMQGTECTGHVWQRNNTSNCTYGIVATSSTWVKIVDNNVFGRTPYGAQKIAINLGGTATSEFTPGRGIKVEGISHGALIAFNHVTDTGLFGTYVQDSPHVRVIGNHYSHCGADSSENTVVLSGFNQATATPLTVNCLVEGNTIRGASGIAIWLYGSDGVATWNTAKANIIDSPIGLGIQSDGDYNTISFNTIVNPGSNGSITAGIILNGGNCSLDANVFNMTNGANTYPVYSSGTAANYVRNNRHAATLTSHYKSNDVVLSVADGGPFTFSQALSVIGSSIATQALLLNAQASSGLVVQAQQAGSATWKLLNSAGGLVVTGNPSLSGGSTNSNLTILPPTLSPVAGEIAALLIRTTANSFQVSGNYTTQRFVHITQPTVQESTGTAFALTTVAAWALDGLPSGSTQANPLTITNAIGAWFGSSTLNHVTNAYAIQIDAVSGGATNNAGVYISAAPSGGSGFNDAIHVAAGSVYLGGNVGFYGTTPIAQPSAVGSATGYAAGTTSASFHSDDTYTGNVGSTAYTINGIVAALKHLGLIAS